MKVFYRNKILITGLFPMIDFKIDGYIQKTGTYDKTIINTKHDDYIFYSGGYLVQSMYAIKDKKDIFYEYFENDELFEIEVSTLDNKDKLNEELLDKISVKVQLLEKKLRLITNLHIGLPIFKATIYDENNNFITYVGEVCAQSSGTSISKYDKNMKELLQNRLKFHIIDETLLDLESKNNRYKRAITFFINSFVPSSNSIRFTLLFSALESLFNIDGSEVCETISEYGSKILFLDSKKNKKLKMKLKDYYDIRSSYIHGNVPRPITEKNEFDLREIIREILLIYWNISISQNIFDATEMMNYLDKVDPKSLDLTIQLFIKCLHITDYDSFYSEVRSKLTHNQPNSYLC